MRNVVTRAVIAATIALGAFATIGGGANAAQVDVIVKKQPTVVVKPIVRKPVIVRPVVRKPIVVVKPVVRNPVVIKPVVVKPVIVKPVVVRPAIVVRKPIIVAPAGRCTEEQAIQKAARAGLNHVSVRSVGPNRVTISGKHGGVWQKMTFANAAGCPRL